MKEAVKFFTIVYAVFIGIILIIYYFGSYITEEVIIVLHYAFIFFAILYYWFQKTIGKNKIRIRIKRVNWNFLICFPFGLLKLYFGYKNHNDLLFGKLNMNYALGMAYILFGLIGFLFFPYILIDKKGIRFKSLTEFSEIKAILVTKHSITFETDTDETTYKIFQLSDKNLVEINKRIDAYRNGVSHK